MESLAEAQLRRALDVALSNADRVGPEARHKLKGILKHYAAEAHPFAACVVGSTPIDTPRDMESHPEGIPISQIRPGDFVWSFNEQLQVFELATVKWTEITRRNAQVYMIILDSGKTIRCTGNHLFLRRDGAWSEARELRTGDSLMPLYRDFMPLVRLDPNGTAFEREYRIVGQAIGVKPGDHVHHSDFRLANSAPRNLEALSASEHASRHHQDAASRGQQRSCRQCGDLFVAERKNQKFCTACPEYLCEHIGSTAECDVCGDSFIKRSHNQKYCSKNCRYQVIEDQSNLTQARVCVCCGEEFVPNSGPQKICSDQCRETMKETYKERAMARKRNHKVSSVVALAELEDVWDMEVEGTHNFVVHGVVLHNCVRDNRKRFGDRAEAVCAVLKDIIRGTTHWRGKNNPNDRGAPGIVGLSEQDEWDTLIDSITDEQWNEIQELLATS